MALKFSTTLRNAQLDAVESTIGTTPVLRIYTGTPPGVGNAATGTLLCSMTLPSDWLAAASSGVKSKSGTWSGVGAAAGTAGYARIWNSGISTGHIEGTVGTSSTDFIIDNATIAVGQTVTVSTFALTAGNA